MVIAKEVHLAIRVVVWTRSACGLQLHVWPKLYVEILRRSRITQNALQPTMRLVFVVAKMMDSRYPCPLMAAMTRLVTARSVNPEPSMKQRSYVGIMDSVSAQWRKLRELAIATAAPSATRDAIWISNSSGHQPRVGLIDGPKSDGVNEGTLKHWRWEEEHR